jgi:transglutaminase-like putative cysteine protease
MTMRIRISHHTTYRYVDLATYAIQAIRLTPRDHIGQRVVHWRVFSEYHKRLPETEDGHGNIVTSHTVNFPHEQSEIIVEGVVEVENTGGYIAGASDVLPVNYFLNTTDLTEVGPKTTELVAGVLAAGGSGRAQVETLMHAVRNQVDYQQGQTEVATSAEQALTIGAGVCQDHAHVLVAAARKLGLPARYISGYLCTGEEDEEATHAWAEIYTAEEGWLAADPSNDRIVTDAYVRVAAGLDYWQAAPIRGVWRGASEEAMDVTVQIRQIGAQQQ